MAAGLIDAAMLLLFVPAVWLALRLKDRWLGGDAAGVRTAVRHKRYLLALLVPEIPLRTGARRFSHARRQDRQSLRRTPSSRTTLCISHGKPGKSSR